MNIAQTPQGMSREIESLKSDVNKLREKLARVNALLLDIAVNFDCDEDAHNYGTLCRSCAANQFLAGVHNG